jgi:RNA polymerase sigma-70 factor (ECF subfamily)
LETVLKRGLAVAVARPGTLASEADFDDMVRLHQRGIHRLLLTLVRDPEEAGNLTQECFLRAYRARDGFRGQASMRTWLGSIAVNLARDHAKNRRQSFWRRLFASREEPAQAAEQVAASAPSPERVLLAREALAAVWAAVDKLPGNQRTAFLLRFVEEMSLEEIAQVMDIEVGTVKSHLARAVGALRHLRGCDYGNPTPSRR